MITPPGTSVVSPVLIGRETALNHLALLLAEVMHGRGQVALIAGEAGIGKSRLLAEIRARFLVYRQDDSPHQAQRAVLALQGRCFEQDRSLPYAPIIDLLRTLFITCSPGELAAYLGSA